MKNGGFYGMKIIYFDTETTGLNPETDQIIEIALLTINNKKLTEKYNKYIKTENPLPKEIINLTGITNETITNEGVPEQEIAKDLYERLTPKTLMIAHNCQFDLNFIYQLLIKYYPENEIETLFNSIYWLDTLTIFRDRKRYPHKLVDMVEYYHIPNANFHRAIDDTIMLFKCVKALYNERNDIFEYINVFGYNSKYGVQGKEFDCIRYVPQGYSKGMVGKDFILPLL